MTTEQSKPAGALARREIEIQATPEQVWQAIATGPGNAAWLFPADIEEREGGAMVIHRAPYGGDAPATVTAYDRPRRFAYEEPQGGMGDASLPPWATEFLIEARAGGTTVLRVITGFYEGGEGWEEMVQGAGEGWNIALHMLRGYVTNFAGQPRAGLGASGDTGQPLDVRAKLSSELLGALNLTGLTAGDKFRGPDDAPPLAGVVEHADQHFYVVRTEDPAPGLFEISTFSMDGQTVTLNVVGNLYGSGRDDIAKRDEPRWSAWLKERFPSITATVGVPQ